MKNMQADLTSKDKLPKGRLNAFSIKAIETFMFDRSWFNTFA
jgi:hypothetical protein